MNALHSLDPVRGPVCGVFAAAINRAAALPFKVTFNTAAAALKRKGNWKGRMHGKELRFLLDMIGVKYTEAEGFRGQSLKTVARELDPAVKHIIFVTGHFLTLYAGQAYDQSNPHGCLISGYKWENSRIKFVLKLENMQ